MTSPQRLTLLGDVVQHRLAFVGPFGVGKTTALRAVSDIPVVNTDVWTHERVAGDAQKTHTTVGFDYGEWQFPDGLRVGLCGLPGQARFGAVWDALLPQSSGVILWLFGNQPHAVTEMCTWLDAIAARMPITRLTVAVTRLPPDHADELLDPFRQRLSDYHPLAPVLSADPRKASDVRQAIAVSLASPSAPILMPD
jgi:signal recognition particle receptor subunit beta